MAQQDTAFGVGGPSSKEDTELRALYTAAHFGAGRDANVFVEGLRFEPEPLTLDASTLWRRVQVAHIVSGACQHAP